MTKAKCCEPCSPAIGLSAGGYSRTTLLGFLSLRRLVKLECYARMSIRVMQQRFTFWNTWEMREGYLRERWIVPGETQDALCYGLLKKEWNDTGIKYQILKRDQLLECLGVGPKAS